MRSTLTPAALATLLTLAFGSPAARADAGRITIEVDGLRSDEGEVRGALFRSEHGWTEQGAEIASCRGSVVGHHATCVFEGIPPGTYAFAFLHDENGDGRLERDWLGFPQEGFGFSNDAHPGLGPPSFQSASFVHERETPLVVHVQYGI